MRHLITRFVLGLTFAVAAVSTNGCTKSSPAADAGKPAAAAGLVVELPTAVTGLFTGTVIYGGKSAQFANATVSKSGTIVKIVFSGGKPPLPAGVPALQNLQFATSNQNGVYDSISVDSSVSGIEIAEFKTNLNVDVTIGAAQIVFTGVKCDVAPESSLCTCVTTPQSPVCQ